MIPKGMKPDVARARLKEIADEVLAECHAEGIGDPDVRDDRLRVRWAAECGVDNPGPVRNVVPRDDPVPASAMSEDGDDDEPDSEELGMPSMET